MYTRERAYGATLKYFKGDELAANVWVDKYCLKKNGVYFELTPHDMHERLADEFARIEMKYPNPMSKEEIFELFKDFKYIVPQGSPMAGIGNNFAVSSVSNCFVIGSHVDSYGGIMMADQEQAQLMKRRGGVGQDISYIRPAGAIAGTTPLGPNAGTTLYMDRFSNTTREVQQDGRRGALMLSISVKHPDSSKFIDKKMTPGKVTGANVSVKITGDFVRALVHDDSYWQVFPIKYDVSEVATEEQREIVNYEEDKLYTGKVIDGVQTYFKKVDPKKIWKQIVYNAWRSAEPGILFWDQIEKESPAAAYGEDWKEVSTNPCGEIPLNPYDSCRLIAINLYSYLFKGFSEGAMLEDGLLKDHVKKAMRLMDDLVDLEIEKIDKILENIRCKEYREEFQEVELTLWEKIKKRAQEGRRTGLGILGMGDLMAGLGYIYGTPQATEFAELLHQFIASAAYESSIELAEERGAFPIWKKGDVKDSDFLTRMFIDNVALDPAYAQRHKESGRRNIAALTIAPTGSTSLMTQTTSGIEPMFAAFSFRKKKVMEGEEYDWVDENGDKWIEFTVFHKPFIDWYAVYADMSRKGAQMELEMLDKDSLKEIFEKSPYFKATAQDVDYVEKVRMQGAVQKWVDHSISVTVNMPEHVTQEMVGDVYMEAYKSGCKGITVYRENSRGNVLSTTSIKGSGANHDFKYTDAVPRPEIVECDVFFRQVRKEEFIVFIGKVHGKPYEVFAIPYNEKTKISKRVKAGRIIKRGKGVYYFETDHGRTGENVIENICDHMIETEQNSTRMFSGLLRHRVKPAYVVDMVSKFATISSFHKVIEKVIMTYVEEIINDPCPKCGEAMTNTEGCSKCPNCGYAKCG